MSIHYESIAQGVASKTLMECLTQFEQEKQAIEDTYEKESIKNPTYTVEQYIMALANYRKVNMTTLDSYYFSICSRYRKL